MEALLGIFSAFGYQPVQAECLHSALGGRRDRSLYQSHQTQSAV